MKYASLMNNVTVRKILEIVLLLEITQYAFARIDIWTFKEDASKVHVCNEPLLFYSFFKFIIIMSHVLDMLCN